MGANGHTVLVIVTTVLQLQHYVTKEVSMMARKITRQMAKPEAIAGIKRKFGGLASLVAMAGVDMTPELENYLKQAETNRSPIIMAIAYEGSYIKVVIS
jgi:hypothetical protein